MTNTEQRIAKMARKMAKVIVAERMAGNLETALRLQAAAIETAEMMRAGRL